MFLYQSTLACPIDLRLLNGISVQCGEARYCFFQTPKSKSLRILELGRMLA